MSKTEKLQPEFTISAWSRYSQITTRVLLCIALSIVLMVGPAYFLDRYFGTWPIISGVALIFSLPISQFLVVKSMQDYIKKNPFN